MWCVVARKREGGKEREILNKSDVMMQCMYCVVCVLCNVHCTYTHTLTPYRPGTDTQTHMEVSPVIDPTLEGMVPFKPLPTRDT